LVAPSWAGVSLAIATFGAFLARQPLKIALVDRRRDKRYARTVFAERFALLYLAIAALGLLAAMSLSKLDILLPLLIAVPFGLVQLLYDARSDSRDLLPEVCGPVALATTSSSIAIAGGWSLVGALGLWAIIVARAVPSVLYVRARLWLEKDKPIPAMPVWITSTLAVLAMIVLWLAGFVPVLAVVAMGILLVRAVYGLSKYRRPVPAKIIGFQELGLGLLTVILAAVGYRISL
jgi:hypothetical protein